MTKQMIPAWVYGALSPVEKLEVHQKGLKHKAVSVFVMNKGRILIQRRALGKYHTPGLWANTCCTHPFWGESDSVCAVRRLEQELGITGLFPTQRDQIEYRAEVGNGLIEHEVVEVFVAEAPDDLAVSPNPDEVMETRWVDYYDLCADVSRHPSNYTPWLKIYLEEHSAAIFGEMDFSVR
ncbi:isopentenyl-diphosphate Delta-isomerase [Loktanella sp. S4079]|uniref:isopentenyl-diphosphate Delta-isomerase n=1 Tax=Loktanella sp. S4079 TaxID=579483 RepID=UPI0005FA3AAF|nr:isopentenyl-diphosphate Delta-isomerase [Loktanella sp. S4079]KJZ21169.1 isopentenyl-diphosphate delta-isomerase [Loktanella sp. S4079]